MPSCFPLCWSSHLWFRRETRAVHSIWLLHRYLRSPDFTHGLVNCQQVDNPVFCELPPDILSFDVALKLVLCTSGEDYEMMRRRCYSVFQSLPLGNGRVLSISHPLMVLSTSQTFFPLEPLMDVREKKYTSSIVWIVQFLS